MSAVIETIIICDGGGPGCEGTYSGGDARHDTASRQRKNYRGMGWRFVKGKDYCPACVKTLPKRLAAGAEGK